MVVCELPKLETWVRFPSPAQFMSFFLLTLIGLLAGVLSGLIGIGGGVLIVPLLVYGLHYSQHDAQGTSLAVLLPPIGILAVWRYWQAGHVHIGPAMVIAIALLMGAAIGAHFAVGIPQLLMKRIFGGVLIVVGILMATSR